MSHDCQHIQELLDEYQTGSLDEQVRAEVDAHLAACEACSRERASLARLMALTRQAYASDPAAVPDLRAAVRARIAPAPSRRMFRLSFLLAPLAASILLVLIITKSSPIRAGADEEFREGMRYYDTAFKEAGPNRQEFLRKGIKVFENLRQRYPHDEEMGAFASVVLADSYRELGDASHAVEIYRNVLREYDKQQEVCIEARVALVDLFLNGTNLDLTAEERGRHTGRELRLLADMQTPPPQTLALCLRFADFQYGYNPLDALPWYEKCVALSPQSREGLQAAGSMEAIKATLKEQAHIQDWWILGPFASRRLVEELPPEKNLDLSAMYDGVGGKVQWRRPFTPKHHGYVDLQNILGFHELSAAYAQTQVFCPERRLVRFEVSSHDPFRVWVNSEVVMSVPQIAADRNQANEKVDVNLRKGWNIVRIKVLNLPTGNWGFDFKATDLNGQYMTDLLFDPNAKAGEEKAKGL